MKFLILFLLTPIIFAAVPTEFMYQGRLLSHDNGRELKGQIKADFLVRLRRTALPGLNPVVFQQKIVEVSVLDGLFTLSIDLSKNELIGEIVNFSEPYAIEVLIGGSGGGKIGSQLFHSLPYAFAAQETALLRGLKPTDLALSSHEHSTPGTAQFTIDGSRFPKATANQFVVKNNTGSNILAIDEDGLMQSVRTIQATSDIETYAGFQLKSRTASPTLYPVMITQYGDLTAAGRPNPLLNDVPGHLSLAGTLYCTTGLSLPEQDNEHYSYQLQDLIIEREGRLLLSASNLDIEHEGANILGRSHQIEDHNLDTPLYSRLEDLLNPQFNANSLHTHKIATGSIALLPSKTVFGQIPVIEQKHIMPGSLVNRHFADDSISDSMLGTIRTPGKIALEALGQEVAVVGENNNFLSIDVDGVPEVGYEDITRADFDGLVLKYFLLTSDYNIYDSVRALFSVSSIDGGIPGGELFSYQILSNGNLKYYYTGADTNFELTRDDLGRHKIITHNLRIQHIETNRQASFFYGGSGGMFQEGSITGANLVDDSIDTVFFQNALSNYQGLATAKFADGVLRTIKLAGGIDGRALADSAITSDIILSIGPDNIAQSSLENKHFATSAVLLDKHFVRYEGLDTGDITGDKICASSGLTKVPCIESDHFENVPRTGADSALLIGEQNIADGAIGAEKIRLGNVIDDKLSVAVLKERTQSIQITLGETAESHISLANSDKRVMMDLSTPDSSGVTVINIEDGNGLRVTSINSDGTINFGFWSEIEGEYKDLQLTAEFVALMNGDATKGGYCGNNDANMRPFSFRPVAEASPVANCYSQKNNHGGSALKYWQAQAFCTGQGYQLCSTDFYLAACRRAEIKSGAFMTSDYLMSDGGPRVLLFSIVTPDANCEVKDDFIVASAVDGNYNFRCCLR